MKGYDILVMCAIIKQQQLVDLDNIKKASTKAYDILVMSVIMQQHELVI